MKSALPLHGLLLFVCLARSGFAQVISCNGAFTTQSSWNQQCSQGHQWESTLVDNYGNVCMASMESYYSIMGGWQRYLKEEHYGPSMSSFAYGEHSWMSNPRECFDVGVNLVIYNDDGEVAFDGRVVDRQWCADNCCVDRGCDPTALRHQQSAVSSHGGQRRPAMSTPTGAIPCDVYRQPWHSN